MQVADRLFAKGAGAYGPDHNRAIEWVRVIRKNIPHSMCIVSGGMNGFVEGVPVAPPFNNLWVEFDTQAHKTGIWMASEDMRHPDNELSDYWTQRGIEIPKDARFFMSAFVVMTINGEARLVTQPAFLFANADGYFIKSFWAQIHRESYYSLAPEFFDSLTTSLLGTLQFLNCKNIRAIDAPELEQTPKWRRRMKAPEIKYKTLVVDGIKGTGGEGTGVNIGQMPLHLVRGHFAHYTDDKPLFGKYTGTFWKPAHARGELKNGAVIKDYKLQPKGGGA